MTDTITEWRGVEGLVYAEVTEDSAEAYETGEVKKLAGVATITRTTESSTEAHYYDNVPAVIINSIGADEITCTVSAIPMEVMADITGQFYDEASGCMIEGEREEKYYALGYIAKKRNGDLVYVWRFKGTFGIPDSTHNTENDGTDANGDEVTFTGVSTTHVFTKTGKRAKAINVDVAQGKADVEGFFDAVTTPDTLKTITY